MDIAIERAPTSETVELLAELDAALAGPYAAMPPRAIELSLFYEKSLR